MDNALLGMLNTPEIILILVLALILFGAKKLPDLAKGLGHGIKEFRKASREITDELNTAIDPPPPPRHSSQSHTEPKTPETSEETVAQTSDSDSDDHPDYESGSESSPESEPPVAKT